MIFIQYFPYVISSSDNLMSGSIDNQTDRQIDNDRGTETKYRSENEYDAQQIGIHSAPVGQPGADAHQLAICFVEFQFVFHGCVASFVR